jgi:tRNA-specific 2-thiouridylase
VLSALAPASLARMRFPLGEMRKPEVRELATKAGLDVAGRRDSQDLCFLAGTRQEPFLARHGGLGTRPGSILDERGKILGEHRGAHFFTVGQRHGLGIGGVDPLYVLATDANANTLTVGPRRGLLVDGIAVREATLHRSGRCVDGVRVRSHGRRFACRLPGAPGAGRHARVKVELAEPAERTAGDVVVGYGTITV